jgi:anti-anti-sigma factor
MNNPYPIDLEASSGLRRIYLSGRMDALSADQIQDALMALVDEGERRLLADLSDVPYLSSAGIRALLIVQKQLHGSSGELILVGAREPVRNVLDTAGLTSLFTLIDNPTELALSSSSGRCGDQGIALEEEGIALRLLSRDAGTGRLRIIGDHAPLARAAYNREHVCTETLETGTYAIGVATTGDRFDEYSRLFGEAMLMDGNFFVLPGVRNPRVDYVLRGWSGTMGRLRFLHGLNFWGEFRHCVQFEDRERPIDLERLRRALFALSDADLLGVVLVAESRGHFGMALRRSPIAGTLNKGEGSIFDAKRFADWFDFSVEPADAGALLAVTGLMARDRELLSPELMERFPRQGHLHLHGLVMQRGHLSRRAADFERELQRILANQLPKEVCHLLPSTSVRAGLSGLIELEV